MTHLYLIITLTLILLQNLSTAIITRTCENFIPQSAEECHAFSDLESYCCYFTDNQHEYANHCKLINLGEYLTHPNYTTNIYAVDKFLNMTVSCGQTITSNQYKSCGNANVTEAEDCVSFNTASSSCCYYNHMGKKGCVNYDYVIKDSVINGNVILQCFSTYIQPIISIILSLFLFFL